MLMVLFYSALLWWNRTNMGPEVDISLDSLAMLESARDDWMTSFDAFA